MNRSSSHTSRNYLYNLLYRLSICVLPLIVTPYTARVLGSEGVGLYSFSSCIACYFIMFSKLGLDSYGSRSIACVRDNPAALSKCFWSIYALQCITAFLSLSVYVILMFTAFQQDLLIYEMQFFYVLSAAFDVSWYFYGMERFKETTLRSLIIRAGIVLCVFLFVHTADDLWIYTLILSLSFLIEQLILFFLLLREVKPSLISWSDIAVHVRPNLHLFLPLALMSIYNWMDKLMIGLIAGNADVAYYNYADSIINLPKGIVLTLGTVMLPQVSRLAVHAQLDRAISMLHQSLEFICFVCCILCFGIAAVAPVFVPIFLGPGYEMTIDLTMGLALVMIPLSLSDTLQNQYLVPFHKERIYTIAVSVGAIINLVLNLLLIPFLGAVGAVIGTIGAAVGTFLCQMFQIRQILSLRQIFHSLWPYFLSGIIEFVAVYPLKSLFTSPILTLLIQLLLGGGVYILSSMLLLSHFRPQTWNQLLQLVKQKFCKN